MGMGMVRQYGGEPTPAPFSALRVGGQLGPTNAAGAVSTSLTNEPNRIVPLYSDLSTASLRGPDDVRATLPAGSPVGGFSAAGMIAIRAAGNVSAPPPTQPSALRRYGVPLAATAMLVAAGVVAYRRYYQPTNTVGRRRTR